MANRYQYLIDQQNGKETKAPTIKNRYQYLIDEQNQGPLPLERKFQLPYTPPAPSAPDFSSGLMPAHTVSLPQPQPDYKSAWIQGTLGSLVGRAVTPLVEKATGRTIDLSTLPQPKTTGEKALSFVGSNLSDLPLWMAGDALLAKPLGALAKTAPVAKAINVLPKAITPALGTGIKAGTTWAGGIAPLTSAVTGENLADLEKQTPYIVAGGAALHGAGQLVGEGINGVQNVITDRRLGDITQPLSEAVQNAYKVPSLRDAEQNAIKNAFNNRKINADIQNPLTFKPIQQAIDENIINSSVSPLTQSEYEQVFGSPIRKYSFQTGKQQLYEDIFNRPTPNNPAEYFGNKTQSDLEAAFGKPVNKYGLTTQPQREYNTLFSGNDEYFSPKREAAKANSNPQMYFGNQTQSDVESAFRPIKSYLKSGDTQRAIAEVESAINNHVEDIKTSLKQAYKETDKANETIYRQINNMGGISPSKNGAFSAEYREFIPLYLKNKNGLPLDQAADELGMTASELLDRISEHKNKPKRNIEAEAYQLAEQDPHYQSLNQTLNYLKDQNKTRTVNVKLPNQRVESKPLVPNFSQQRDISGLRLQPRDVTNSRIGKPYPFDQRTTRISEISKPDVALKRTVTPGLKIEPPIPQNRLRTEPIIPERLTWTNKDNIPNLSPLPLRSITPENVPKINLPNPRGSILEIPVVNGRTDVKNAVERPQSFAANMESPTPLAPATLTINPNQEGPARANIVSSFDKTKTPKIETLHRLYRETVNNTQGINRTIKGLDLKGSDNPVVMTTNARNAGGTVDHIINHGLVDMNGKQVVDKSIADAFKEIPKDKQQVLDEYLYHLHNIDRMREGKPVFGGEVSISDSKKAIVDLERENPNLNLKEKASIVRKTLDELLNKWGVDSGLVSPELRDHLQEMYKNYVPTYRKLSEANAMVTKSRSTGAAKIINKANGGNEDLITLRESIPMLINKTVKAARKNEVYKGILEAARINPDNGFAKVLGEDMAEAESIANSIRNDGLEAIASAADKALQSDPKLGYLLTVMEDGKPIKVQVNKELFESLQALNKVDDSTLNKYLRGFKKYATNPFKALITGYNPFFAVRNIARDIPTAYIQGTENNPFKFVGNLGKATKDIVTRDPRYKEFQALGGQGGNFFNVERGAIQAPNPLKKGIGNVGKAISSFNNFTETLPRYGEYLGTLKRGGEGYSNKMQALHNAAEVTVNFGRHGDLTKSADAVIPYLNPAVQGLDKFRKTMLKPVNVAKAIGSITIPTTGFYALNQMVDKKGYDQLDNRTKDTYFLVPEGNGKFIKIAKSREAGVLFGALFERIARTVEGQTDSFKGFGNTLKTNFIPNDPINNNLFSPIINTVLTNKDFAKRDIVPSYMISDKRSPALQYDDKTSEIAKQIGDKFNLSPKQIDYLIKSYSGVIGSLLLPATTKGGKSVGNVISQNFVSDANYNNDIQNNFYDKLDQLRQAATDKNLRENIPSKRVTPEEKQYNEMLKISKQLSEFRKQQLKAQTAGDKSKADALQMKLLETAGRATK